MKRKLTATERWLQHYIISQQVQWAVQMRTACFSVQRFLTVAYWPLLYILYTMEQSPSWEANRSSASQEIPCILWNSKVHFCIYNSLPPVPILSQINLFHALYNISLKLILISLRSSKSSVSPRFPHQKYILPNSWPNFRLLWPCIMNVGWRERNQHDATNVIFIITLLSQHVSGIILPIIRRTRVFTVAYGVLHC